MGKKLKCTAKPVALPLAIKLYWDGASLAQVANMLKIDPECLKDRFKHYSFPTKTMSEAKKGRPNYKIRGPNHPQWIRGFKINEDGYVIDSKSRRGYHIIVAEKVLGRRLKKGEIVHHLNENRKDNRNCNLLVCSHSYHCWLHAEMRRKGFSKTKKH